MACNVSYAPLPSIVLQCRQCRLICGDTTELVASVACGDLRLVVLRAATDVKVDRASVRAGGEHGPGGRYFNVCCTGCGSALGRLYSEAATGLECLLNNFSFDASKCTSYELGSSEIRVASAAEPGSAAAAAATPAGPARALNGADAVVVAELAARVELLEAELTKMQGMVLLHEAQLRQLPAHPEQQQQQGGGWRPAHTTTPGYQQHQPPGAELLTSGSLQQFEQHLRTSMGGIG